MDWEMHKSLDGFEEVWESNRWPGWTIFVNVHGTELWWRFTFCGKFESKDDAANHVKRVEEEK